MEIISDLLGSGNTGLLIAVGCCLLCVVGVIILIAFSLLGTVFDLLGNGLEFFLGIFNALPIPGCGCVLVFGGCALIVGAAWFVVSGLAGCANNYTNFCALLGQ